MVSDTIANRIIWAIADVEGVEPTRLHPPLASVVDVDEIGRLVQKSPELVQITFDYLEWTVIVNADGHIDIAPNSE